MIRKFLVGMAGAVATDYLTDQKSVKDAIDKMIPAGSTGNGYYAALNGLGALLAVKYFGG